MQYIGANLKSTRKTSCFWVVFSERRTAIQRALDEHNTTSHLFEVPVLAWDHSPGNQQDVTIESDSERLNLKISVSAPSHPS
jgi:hypothetical protein